MGFLSEVNGWSPVIHSMAGQPEIGLVTAAVYGAVWRYCQMESRVCTASLETIGDDLGIDKATALRHIKKLCKMGYLKDETPNLRNVPHTYSDTGKILLAGKVEAQTVADNNTLPKTVADNNTLPKTVADNNTLPKTVAQRNATVAQRNATVAESQLNTVINRDFKKSERAHTPDKILAEHKDFAIKLVRICGYAGPEFVVNGRLRDCAEAVTQLTAWGATVEQLAEFENYWWGDTPPTFKQVVEEWGKFKAGAGRAEKPAGSTSIALDDAKRAAYLALQAEHAAAVAETEARVSEAMDQAKVFGVDVEREVRRAAGRMKK